MKIHAFKYQGAGNDFVIIDNRYGRHNLSTEQIRFLCDRRFGIGGDGFMYLECSKVYDFAMRYFNSDGKEGTMCGNGGRCLVAFAAHQGIRNYEFEAIDGYHKAEILDYGRMSTVKLKMKDIRRYLKYSPTAYFLNTGSPHYVEFVSDLNNYPVEEKGRYWRYHPDFEGGTNANFVEIHRDHINVRTFERGVEAETFACGTGVTAAAISTFLYSPDSGYSSKYLRDEETAEMRYDIKALGGDLAVTFRHNQQTGIFSDVYLIGPATLVFETDIEL